MHPLAFQARPFLPRDSADMYAASMAGRCTVSTANGETDIGGNK